MHHNHRIKLVSF